MSKRKSGRQDSLFLPKKSNASARSRKSIWIVGMLLGVMLVTAGVFAENGWFPSTDPLTGKRTGWFGKQLSKNASNNWNPLSEALPRSTPQLSKEYIYAGSQLLAVEDANADAAPPIDLAVWRPTSGDWWVLGGGEASHQVSQNWGSIGDDPVEGDYDGDGKTDFSVFRGSTNTWYLMYSSTGTTIQFAFGIKDDVPAPADYDGDGKTDPTVFRPSTGEWYINQSSNLQTITQKFGLSIDTVAPADYDGDGRADVAVWRAVDRTFYSINSSNTVPQVVSIGQTGTPVSSDYDGDGKADYAVYNSINANWHIRYSTTGQILWPIQWGLQNDIPVQNDYDGDGKCDIAVWRPNNTPGYTDAGNWYIVQSASGGSMRQVQWGVPGDIPVPAFYRR